MPIYLSIGEFNLFTLKVITDKEGLISVILLFVFYMYYIFLGIQILQYYLILCQIFFLVYPFDFLSFPFL